jgi:hypothetical protein
VVGAHAVAGQAAGSGGPAFLTRMPGSSVTLGKIVGDCDRRSLDWAESSGTRGPDTSQTVTRHEIPVPSPPGDGPNGPVAGFLSGADPYSACGGCCASQMIERFTRVARGILTIDDALSTWNPNTVELMRPQLASARPPERLPRAGGR